MITQKKSKNTKLSKNAAKAADKATKENKTTKKQPQIPISFVTICDPGDFDYLEEQKEVLPKGAEHVIIVCKPQTEHKWTLYNELNHYYGQFIDNKEINAKLEKTLKVDSVKAGVLKPLGTQNVDGIITKLFEHNYYKDDKINTFSFALARNLGMKAASRDWVIMLDADERIYLERRHIEIFKQLPPDVGGVIAQIVNYFPPAENPRPGNEYGKTLSNSNMRCVRNNCGLFFINKVHEMASPSIEMNNMRMVTTDIFIKHIGFAKNGAAMLDKYYRNLQGMLPDLRQRIYKKDGNWITDYQLEKYIFITLRDIQKMREEARLQKEHKSGYSRLRDGDRYQEKEYRNAYA